MQNIANDLSVLTKCVIIVSDLCYVVDQGIGVVHNWDSNEMFFSEVVVSMCKYPHQRNYQRVDIQYDWKFP